MNIVVWSCYWGKYVDYFNRYSHTSIISDIEKLRSEGHKVIEQYDRLNDSLPRFPDEINHSLILAMKLAIAKNAYFFLLMPDTIYSEDTLYNCAKYAEHRNIYVAWPHFRFIAEDVEKINIDFPITSLRLMDILWPHQHQTTVYANIDAPMNLSRSRQSVRNVGNYSVVNHCYPTIYFFKPDEDDINCWVNRDRKDWIWYDTGFFKHAVGTKRCRILGSSDFVFCAELENRESHNHELSERSYNDRCDHRRGEYSDMMLMTAYVIPRKL